MDAGFPPSATRDCTPTMVINNPILPVGWDLGPDNVIIIGISWGALVDPMEL